MFIASVAGLAGTALLLAAGCSKSLDETAPGVLAQMPVVFGSSHHTTHAASERGAKMGLGPSSLSPEQQLADADRPVAKNGLCPPDMASIDDLYCVDRYEASLLEMLPNGDERPWPYFEATEGHEVRAVSVAHVKPQGYISEKQAILACAHSGKRLCKPAEWRKACMGPAHKKYGYSDTLAPHRCNDDGTSPVVRLFAAADPSGHTLWTWDKMNNPELNQLVGTLAKTGDHDGCTNGYGVYDMVGNLHEWVDDPQGTFLGGYYQDIHENGDGCGYRTDAHAAWYHDYSTGFRCCEDVSP